METATARATYPHILNPPNAPARLQDNPRWRVAQVIIPYVTYGWSADEICRQYTVLKPAEVYAAFVYYFDHQEEIDREIAEEFAAEVDRTSATPSSFYLRMRAKGLL